MNAVARPGQRGFSLLEILLIVALMALMIGSGALALSRLRRDGQLRGPARQLSEAIARAGWEAREQQSPVQLLFDESGLRTRILPTATAVLPPVGSELAQVPPLVSFAGLNEVSLITPGGQSWVSLRKEPVSIVLDPQSFSPGFSLRLRSAHGRVEQDYLALTGELAQERSSTEAKKK